jgi:sulfoacetaldehyde acetyltransferase
MFFYQQEKKNQVLWFGDRYVGSQLKNPSFAEVARSMGAEGIQVDNGVIISCLCF